jgi:bifunctional DNA-binding transcriptional regulator/antitoxin component of YhaV-PrlF toxin-antitoxin module
MDDKPEFEELDGDSNPVGDMETRKVQSLGRVDVPNEYLEQIDAEEGNKVLVICEEDEVIITKATKDKAFNNVR